MFLDFLCVIGLLVDVTSSGKDSHKLSLHRLDEADLIVPMISHHFITDMDKISELHVAINRQRASKGE